MKIILLSVILFIILIFNSSSPGDPLQTITFGTDANYAPFAFVDSATGRIVGYDIDIANALCAQLRARCHIVNQPWVQLIPELKANNFDAAIRAMSITQGRLQEVNFTKPYYNTTGSIIARSNEKLTLSAQDLAGKTIGVQKGTTFEAYLLAEYGNKIKIKAYQDLQTALLDLAIINHKIRDLDAVIGDSPVIDRWLSHQPPGKYQIIGTIGYNNEEIFGTGFGIAVNKDNVQLLNNLNKALNEIKANGVYKKINEKYFSEI